MGLKKKLYFRLCRWLWLAVSWNLWNLKNHYELMTNSSWVVHCPCEVSTSKAQDQNLRVTPEESFILLGCQWKKFRQEHLFVLPWSWFFFASSRTRYFQAAKQELLGPCPGTDAGLQLERRLTHSPPPAACQLCFWWLANLLLFSATMNPTEIDPWVLLTLELKTTHEVRNNKLRIVDFQEALLELTPTGSRVFTCTHLCHLNLSKEDLEIFSELISLSMLETWQT